MPDLYILILSFFLSFFFSVALIVLLGDGIQTLYPHLDLFSTRIISFLILSPTLFLPVKKLAYTSLIGIIACICLVIIVFYDGVTKKVQPGSLFDPMVCYLHVKKKSLLFVYIKICCYCYL